MTDLKVLIFILSIVGVCLTTNPTSERILPPILRSYEPGVYWREWSGQIPEDALVAGFTSNSSGDAIYLGQGYTKDKKDAGIQAGQLFEDSKSLVVSFDGVHKINKTVKILCGDPEALEWRSFDKIEHIDPKKEMVLAGFENDYELYFARGHYKDKLIVGKVVMGQNKTMYFPTDNGEETLYSFEALCYKRRLIPKKD